MTDFQIGGDSFSRASFLGTYSHFSKETLSKFFQSWPLILVLVWAGHFGDLQLLCCQIFGRNQMDNDDGP